MDTPTPSSPGERKRDRGSVIGGIVLIVIGLLFLADRFLDVSFGDIWPLILVAIGGAMLWRSRDDNHPQGGQP
jgi:phage shock protein C